MHTIVATLCGYETVAILSHGKIPTITVLDKRSKHVIAPVILGGLAIHFYAVKPRGETIDVLNYLSDKRLLRLR